MPSGVGLWSTTAASNASADPTVNWAEGQAPSTVNDSARALMASVAVWYAQLGGGVITNSTVGGTSSAVTLTNSTNTFSTRNQGQIFVWKSTSDLAASATLAVDGLTAASLTIKGVAISAGHIKSGDLVATAFDGTNYEIVSYIRETQVINAQTGTTYTVLSSDRGNLVTVTNVAAIAITLPQATSAGAFSNGYWTEIENISTSSLATITPTTSTINGAASLIVYPGQRYKITSNGTNYRAVKMGSDIWRYSAKGANYTLLPADVAPSTVFDFTTSSTTISTAVAASNFSGGIFVLKNSAASGDVTFDPNSTETIDGVTTLIVHPGQTYIIQCDGSNWKSIGDNVLMKSSAIASKTTSYTATTADRGKSIRFAGLAADATLSLPAAATCGDGFVLYVSNEDTTDAAPFGVIVDPSSTELIDGVSTRKGYTGTRVTLLCDGTGWRTVSGNWSYFSGNQTISSAGTFTLAHGLGVAPKRVWASLKCLTAEINYSIGDIVFQPMYDHNSTNIGIAAVADATNLTARIGSAANPFSLLNKTTGAATVLTNASWAIRLHAQD